MNILSIQSHVAYGHVGNAVAVFAMQRLGCEVWPIHTVQFSNHPGHGGFRGRVFEGAHIAECVAGIDERGVLATCDAVLTGYLGTREAGEAALDALARIKGANPGALYACDPVMGDAGPGVYVRPELVAFLRDKAVPKADIITPNLFELRLLTGGNIQTEAELRASLATLHMRGPRLILVTSANTEETPEGMVDVVLSCGSRELLLLRTPQIETQVNGAGDCIAALFLARYLQSGNAVMAASLAVSSVFGILSRTAEANARELCLIDAQAEIIAPSWMFEAERL